MKRLSSSISSSMENIDLDEIKRGCRIKLKDFRRLSSGLSRVVFVHKNNKYVLKIEIYPLQHSLHQNKTEAQNYCKIPKQLKKHFAKVLLHSKDFRWIVQEKVESVNDSLDYNEATEIRRELERIFVKNRFKDALHDLHGENVGKLNGEGVMFDYGYKEF